ncbi:hemerythrin domain-containing protein [Kitasatospora viridis]|uniref:Hemerythrin HHE cation binding domain-containing protein n=1 Tax=Kitasatospora viridis TaxID=281105 RepID=A0A561SEB4_9ACTN|nr:hemerythrin domain-containing protein [Kitasatospora viridis]TWF73200.1 hemerythrin HHE cation binding domain-containing protein [Kitasatospora viridis]
MASQDGDRTAALSLQLARAHQELRRRIGGIRSDLGRERPRSGDDTLLTHCLAFCAALTAHHQGEDGGLFAQLLHERPDLAPTIAKLVEDHALITDILTRVGRLADRAAGSPAQALAAIGRELDGLAAIMESHFAYEERALGEALDHGLPDTGWSGAVLRFDPA